MEKSNDPFGFSFIMLHNLCIDKKIGAKEKADGANIMFPRDKTCKNENMQIIRENALNQNSFIAYTLAKAM